MTVLLFAAILFLCNLVMDFFDHLLYICIQVHMDAL